MTIRIRRFFPEHPLSGQDYPGGTLKITFRWDCPPEPGWVRFTDRPHDSIPPGQQDFSASLHVAEREGEWVGQMYVQSNARLLHVSHVQGEEEVLAALISHAVAEAGERSLIGYAPDTRECRQLLRSFRLHVLEGAGAGRCLFYTHLPPEMQHPQS